MVFKLNPNFRRLLRTHPKATLQLPTENVKSWTQNIGDFKYKRLWNVQKIICECWNGCFIRKQWQKTFLSRNWPVKDPFVNLNWRRMTADTNESFWTRFGSLWFKFWFGNKNNPISNDIIDKQHQINIILLNFNGHRYAKKINLYVSEILIFDFSTKFLSYY